MGTVSTTRVVHVRYSDYTVYIGRTGAWKRHLAGCEICQRKFAGYYDWCPMGLELLGWGNPYEIGPDGNREQVIEKYRNYLWRRIKRFHRFRLAVRKLRGQVLGCWCRGKVSEIANVPCHGDVLAEAAERLNS